jgi:hypothetical protein
MGGGGLGRLGWGELGFTFSVMGRAWGSWWVAAAGLVGATNAEPLMETACRFLSY